MQCRLCGRQSHCFNIELKAKHKDPGIPDAVGICGTLVNLQRSQQKIPTVTVKPT